MIASRAHGLEGDGRLEGSVGARVHRVNRPERVGQEPAHDLEPVLGDLDSGRLHAVTDLFQGHSHPPVWENTATSNPRGGGGRLMARASRLLIPLVLLAAVVLAVPGPVFAQGSLHVYCSVQAEWCQAVANEFQRQTGIRVGLTLKGSGETLAQVTAEAANPKGDVWFGGTG